MDKKPYIIAEAAQGYEGSVEISNLLVRSAAKANADAIKFQVVYADDLAEKDYEYYELFKSLEMGEDDWKNIRSLAKELSVDFIIDVFGPQSLDLAKQIKADGIKIHSTCFFDEEFFRQVLGMKSHLYLSTGGIYPDEIKTCINKYNLKSRPDVTLMYGFQAEPTPVESNNLARIPEYCREYGIQKIGFMDHSDGNGPYTETLSAVALGMGVRVFEKHITLDRALEMEDYISALNVADFHAYVEQIHGLYAAIGSASLSLTDAEEAYRGRAIKRVVAKDDYEAGVILSLEKIKLSRPSNASGSYKLEEIVGRTLQKAVRKGEGIEGDMVG